MYRRQLREQTGHSTGRKAERVCSSAVWQLAVADPALRWQQGAPCVSRGLCSPSGAVYWVEMRRAARALRVDAP